jgi:hypothetical protein
MNFDFGDGRADWSNAAELRYLIDGQSTTIRQTTLVPYASSLGIVFPPGSSIELGSSGDERGYSITGYLTDA